MDTSPLESKMETAKPVILDGYAYEQINRTLVRYTDQIEEQLGDDEGPKAIAEVKIIVENWNQDKIVESLVTNLSSLIEISSAMNNLEGTKEMNLAVENLKRKPEKLSNFKDRLRKDRSGVLSKLVGMYLLEKTQWDKSLLNEPLVLVGIDTTTELLKDEHDRDSASMQTEWYTSADPDLQEFLRGVMQGNLETINELKVFKESIQKNS